MLFLHQVQRTHPQLRSQALYVVVVVGILAGIVLVSWLRS